MSGKIFFKRIKQGWLLLDNFLGLNNTFLNPKKTINNTLFIKNYLRFKASFKKSKIDGTTLKFYNIHPCLNEDTDTTPFDNHYVYHTAWASRKLKTINPEEHYDISSSLFFSTIVSAFIKTHFFDYRPADLKLNNLTSNHADLLNLDFKDNSISSLSCMHVVEHIGLGRYGDPIDANGDIKAMNELIRVLAEGGNFLFVTPVGKSRIMYNAHRIYDYDTIIKRFSGLKLLEFSLIPDWKNGHNIIPNASKEQSDKQNYGCGLFWFTKPYSNEKNLEKNQPEQTKR